ncbi:MAG TPA: hypothetical protein VLK22_00140 [Candidatus Udaeobacter sp.]|nr:hypothetical protein [Candidatus Udaeobacter sp.]
MANDKKPIVEITINNTHYSIERGNYSVEQIKNLGHVPLADDLLEILDKKLKTLNDNAHVEIKGGEVFVSHPKGSASS